MNSVGKLGRGRNGCACLRVGGKIRVEPCGTDGGAAVRCG